MSREEREARVIQQALLPKSSPYIPGFAISGLSIPAGAVGGDWYDFISFDDGCWGLVLADVSGKGTAAALADVRNSRDVALPGANLQRPGRSADAAESLAGRRFPFRQVRHHAVCGAESLYPDVDIFQRRAICGLCW